MNLRLSPPSAVFSMSDPGYQNLRNLTRPKAETFLRKVSIPQMMAGLLIQEHVIPYMFPSPVIGEMYYPDSVINLYKKISKDVGALQ